MRTVEGWRQTQMDEHKENKRLLWSIIVALIAAIAGGIIEHVHTIALVQQVKP